jgi:hypothetical protein
MRATKEATGDANTSNYNARHDGLAAQRMG